MQIVLRSLTTAVTIVLAAGAARAEFQISGSAAPTVPAPDATPAIAEEGPPTPPAPRTWQPGIARGFGKQIPLSFAVRQIVPQGVKASFAPDVDADALLVDWHGGRPWPDVLRSLLRPANLQVTFRPGAVLIERWSPA